MIDMTMMNSGCTAAGCREAQSPIKLSTADKLHRWAEADRDFLRMICQQKKDNSDNRGTSPPSLFLIHTAAYSPEMGRIENYNINAGRQKYLRSYRFTREREETGIPRRIINKWRKLIKSQPHHVVSNPSQSHCRVARSANRPCSTLAYVFGFFFFCCVPPN